MFGSMWYPSENECVFLLASWDHACYSWRVPSCSMYEILTYISHKFKVNILYLEHLRWGMNEGLLVKLAKPTVSDHTHQGLEANQHGGNGWFIYWLYLDQVFNMNAPHTHWKLNGLEAQSHGGLVQVIFRISIGWFSGFIWFHVNFRGVYLVRVIVRYDKKCTYMGVSLNGGTPKTPPKWSILVGKP